MRRQRAFRNSDKQSISELKLAKDIIFKLIEKRLFSRFCSLYPSVFCGSPKSFLGVTKWPQETVSRDVQKSSFGYLFSEHLHGIIVENSGRKSGRAKKAKAKERMEA